jgi:hypothetical protein
MQKGGHMTKLVIGLSALVLLAAGGALAGGALTDSTFDDDSTTSTQGTTTNDTTTLGTTTTETGDISGPCDEAEHANDPRCTGATTVERDDDRRGRRNRGRDDDRGHGDDHGGDEDRSGPNRGPG